MSLIDLPERVVRWFDDVQQDHRILAQPVGTIRKYADDRGSALSGLVTFQVFLGMLPLLVVALTVFGSILENSDSLREAVVESTASQFPLIGDRLKEGVSGLVVSGPWLAVTLAGLLWTSTGIYNSFQYALNQVWNVEGVDRQGFVSRTLRALVLFVLVFAAAIGTFFLRQTELIDWLPGWASAAVTFVIGSIVAGVLLLAVFRISVAPAVHWRKLVPAAVVAGILWEALQWAGSWIVADRLSRAQTLYGAIGFVVVTLFWINLLARSAVFANELAVVGCRGLWPRRITQPPLTPADRRVLEDLVGNERRRPEQHVTVTFDRDRIAGGPTPRG